MTKEVATVALWRREERWRQFAMIEWVREVVDRGLSAIRMPD